MKNVIILGIVLTLLTNCLPVFSQIIDDFQVNDLQGISNQELSSLAVDDSGNFVIAWVDMRGWDFKVYAKQFKNDGTAIDSSFLVSEEDSINFFFTRSAIAVDGEGNFIILWHAFRENIYNMYAQRYQKNGEKIGENIVINDSPEAEAEIASIAMNSSGNFIVVWEDRRIENNDIFAQRFLFDGTPLDSNFQINDDENVWHSSPCVSINEDGDFVISWEELKGNIYGIFAKRFHSDGTAAGDIFLVDDDPEYSSSSPNIASDSLGNFIITWSSGPLNEYSDKTNK